MPKLKDLNKSYQLFKQDEAYQLQRHSKGLHTCQIQAQPFFTPILVVTNISKPSTSKYSIVIA